MTDWEKMFQGMQTIVRTAASFKVGLQQTVAFAQNDIEEYDSPEYWSEIEQASDRLSTNTVIDWAKEGLENLDYTDGWDFLILNLGDCPEIFYLYSFKDKDFFVEEQFHDLLFKKKIIDFFGLAECLTAEGDDPEKDLYQYKRLEWVYHNVKELKDDVLSWNIDSLDFKGNNGYLLWLAFGSLALIEPLREQEYCKKILRGRNKLYLLSGFEEIFFYLGTITPAGMIFETTETPKQNFPGVIQLSLFDKENN